MTTYTRTLSTIAAAAVAFATAVSAGAGQPPAGRGPGPGQGRGGPGGPLPILRQLNLTDAQREQVKALDRRTASARRRAVAGPKAQGAAARAQAAVFADTPDSAQIDQLRAGIAEAEAAVLAARVDLQLKVAQILTPEQRKQARELTDRRPGRAGRAGGPRAPESRGKPARNTPVTAPRRMIILSASAAAALHLPSGAGGRALTDPRMIMRALIASLAGVPDAAAPAAAAAKTFSAERFDSRIRSAAGRRHRSRRDRRLPLRGRASPTSSASSRRGAPTTSTSSAPQMDGQAMPFGKEPGQVEVRATDRRYASSGDSPRVRTRHTRSC